eukprot:1507823-Lingulodinium_polyedra.AAC.1
MDPGLILVFGVVAMPIPVVTLSDKPDGGLPRARLFFLPLREVQKPCPAKEWMLERLVLLVSGL